MERAKLNLAVLLAGAVLCFFSSLAVGQDLTRDFELNSESTFNFKPEHRFDIAYVFAQRLPFAIRYRLVRQTGINRFWAYGFSLGYERKRF